jgi:mono/diheme cytochrome c family protein
MKVASAIIFAATLALFAPIDSARAAGEAEAAYASACAKCHSPRAIAAWIRKEPDAARRETWLEGYLQKHYAPDAAQRKLVIEHIKSVAAAAR